MNVYFVSIGDRPFAKYTVASFKKYIPDCQVIQITDRSTPMIDGVYRCYRRSFEGHMMLFMMEAFSFLGPETFITTGDDCILNGPIGDDIRFGDHDVAICKRVKPRIGPDGSNLIDKYPYTNGLVVVNNLFFYQDCLDWLRDKMGLWNWWGDMAAIRAVLDTGRYKIKELPEDKYCRIPTRVGQGDGSAVLWHYSGKIRKEWMAYHGQGENLAAV